MTYKNLHSLDELQEQLRKFAEERDWNQFHSPKNLAMALVAEAGELVEQFQWSTQDESRTLPPGKLKMVAAEMADVLIYLARLADILDVDLLRAAKEKIEENRKKYPVQLAYGRADKYTKL